MNTTLMNKKNIKLTSDKLPRQLKNKKNVTKHLKLSAFPGGGDPVVTSSIHSQDLLAKWTLCPNSPGSPLLMLILPYKTFVHI